MEAALPSMLATPGPHWRARLNGVNSQRKCWSGVGVVGDRGFSVSVEILSLSLWLFTIKAPISISPNLKTSWKKGCYAWESGVGLGQLQEISGC